MVLEDASNSQPSDFTSESTPNSDIDPYAAGGGSGGGSGDEWIESKPSSYIRVQDADPTIYINLANLPRPFLISSSDSKNNARINAHYGSRIRGMVEGTSKLIQRPVTQEEADALAFNFAQQFRVSSFGMPLGMAFGLLQFLRTMKSFRFPFWAPFREGSKLSPDRFGPFTGRAARWAWHSSRGSAYGFWYGIFLGPTISGLYSVSQSIALRTKDPRLKDITDAAMKRGQQMREQAIGSRQAREQAEQANQRGESPEMSRKRWETRVEEAKNRRASSGTAAPVDDMSPTGGAFADEVRSQSDGFVSDDWQSQQEQQPWQNDSASSAASTTSSSTTAATTTSSAQNSTGRSQRPSSQQSSSSPKQSGSAWDRLRQDAMSSGNQSKSTPPSKSQTSNSSRSSSSGSTDDSFSFSQGDEDKQLAKSEAQKEFDARIEREREGKDFDDKGRGGRGW